MSYIAAAAPTSGSDAATMASALPPTLPSGDDSSEIALPHLERSIRLLGLTRARVSVFRIALEGPGAARAGDTLIELLGDRVLVDRLPGGDLVAHAPHLADGDDAQTLRGEIDAALRMALFRAGVRLHARARIADIHRDASIVGSALDLVGELVQYEAQAV